LSPARPFTLIDDGRPVELVARLSGDRVRLSPDAVRSALGWELSPEGLCLDAACVPVPAGSSLVTPEGLDLAELAAILDRPLALDAAERAAYLGASARERADALASLQAPDFTLPDLTGRLHSLADQRGRKVLLVVYASW